ncbi:MAG: polysaccharide biosynthesis protein [Bacteroidales bacterium]|nr:polysaccharide biosynthesis protein [Bacteroidales bacterium]
MLDVGAFIKKHITKRNDSLFFNDIQNNKEKLQKQIEGKSVLVIGGAGTIGSAFIKEILYFKPSSLVVVDINENGLTELTRELRNMPTLEIPSDYLTYPMSYSDEVFVKMFKKRNGFDIVANFSAHKHVRSEKDLFSVEALIRNNVLNAKMLLDLLKNYPPKHFFCVSTDKAANPVNIMGASKKIMEELIMTYSNFFPVTTARFANVAFSNGSLPAGFLDRLSKRQPLSAPSDVVRYFVSPEESGQICLLACILGDSGDIYFPKLRKEQMVKFSYIAQQLLKELGYDIEECNSEEEALAKVQENLKEQGRYPVFFSPSDTSGEKPYEEFYTEEEKVWFHDYESLGVVKEKKGRGFGELEELFLNLNLLFDEENTEKIDVVNSIKLFLGNFEHIETGKSLDSKM